MRWMWIDTVVAYEPGRRLVAVKNVSLAEERKTICTTTFPISRSCRRA